MTLLCAVAAVVFTSLGYVWVKYPQTIFRIRNWPGVSREMEMNEGGVKMYQLFGYLQILFSLALILVCTTNM